MNTPAPPPAEPVLVQIRCKVPDCGRELTQIGDAPAANDERKWACMVFIPVCPWHAKDAGHGDVKSWRERRRAAGKDDTRVRTGEWIYWSELRPYVEKARKVGKPQKYAR